MRKERDRNEGGWEPSKGVLEVPPANPSRDSPWGAPQGNSEGVPKRLQENPQGVIEGIPFKDIR